jgi:adenosylcobinamide-phosphate synthase
MPLWCSLFLIIFFDLILGDPRSPCHPIVLMGNTASSIEHWLWERSLWGYGTGIAHMLALMLIWVGGSCALVWLLDQCLSSFYSELIQCLVASLFFAQRSLCEHGWDVVKAARESVESAREATSMLVGRDISKLDEDGCRRAAVESLSENFVDGVLTPLFWFFIFGLPGLVAFKVVSTLDSMVGYKSERYLKFGWAGARMDDVMNFIPARLSVPLLCLGAFLIPKLSPIQCWKMAFKDHALLPSPNSGWSEAAMSGALRKRLCGPIYKSGELACTVWVGNPDAPVGCSEKDVVRCILLIFMSTSLCVLLAWLM